MDQKWVFYKWVLTYFKLCKVYCARTNRHFEPRIKAQLSAPFRQEVSSFMLKLTSTILNCVKQGMGNLAFPEGHVTISDSYKINEQVFEKFVLVCSLVDGWFLSWCHGAFIVGMPVVSWRFVTGIPVELCRVLLVQYCEARFQSVSEFPVYTGGKRRRTEDRWTCVTGEWGKDQSSKSRIEVTHELRYFDK